MRPVAGYTLIELLVVLSILAIMAIVSFANFKGISSDQITDKAIGQIKTFLRLAQSNANSSTLCGGTGGLPWKVKINSGSLDLLCGSVAAAQKSLNLENATVRTIKCAPASSTCPPTGSTFSPPLTITYSALFGKVTFSSDVDTCVNSALTIMLVVRNSKNNTDKCFTISQGGAIDVK